MKKRQQLGHHLPTLRYPTSTGSSGTGMISHQKQWKRVVTGLMLLVSLVGLVEVVMYSSRKVGRMKLQSNDGSSVSAHKMRNTHTSPAKISPPKAPPLDATPLEDLAVRFLERQLPQLSVDVMNGGSNSSSSVKYLHQLVSKRFLFVLDKKASGTDQAASAGGVISFEVTQQGANKNGNSTTVLMIRGTTPVDVAYGFHLVMRTSFNASQAWGTMDKRLFKRRQNEETLAANDKDKNDEVFTGSHAGSLEHFFTPTFSWHTVPLPPHRIKANVKLRYNFNVCTFGYTTPFWDWAEWERELDWMALHGINLALAFIGQEIIWTQLFTAPPYNLSFSDVTNHLTGPAFFPWHWMGNLNKWAGPIDALYMERRRNLQHKILHRMRSLGISPVLPAFAGHLPSTLRHHFSPKDVTSSSSWMGFRGGYTGTLRLQPTSPHFVEIATTFTRLLTKEYGTVEYYNGDTFNEMPPPTNDPTYLRLAGRRVLDGIQAGGSNPQGKWLVQGWMFLHHRRFWTPRAVQAYLSGIEKKGDVLILDLGSDLREVWRAHEGYYGHDFVWCMLHSFGGKNGIFGDVRGVANAVERALIDAQLGTAKKKAGSAIGDVANEIIEEQLEMQRDQKNHQLEDSSSPRHGAVPQEAAHREETAHQLVGLGLTMEAIHHNHIMYELFTDLAFRRQAMRPSASSAADVSEARVQRVSFYKGGSGFLDVNKWVKFYLSSRFHFTSNNNAAATVAVGRIHELFSQKLLSANTAAPLHARSYTEVGPYSNPANFATYSITTIHPVIAVDEHLALGTNLNMEYSTKKMEETAVGMGAVLVELVEDFLDNAEHTPTNNPTKFTAQIHTLRRDTVDFLRQALENAFTELHRRFMLLTTTAEEREAGRLDRTTPLSPDAKVKGQQLKVLMKKLFLQLDVLTALEPSLRLSEWLNDAQRWASAPDVEFDQSNGKEEETLPLTVDRMLFNAKNLITLWGDGQQGYPNYASKSWSGLFMDLYWERWDLLFDVLLRSPTPSSSRDNMKNSWSGRLDNIIFDVVRRVVDLDRHFCGMEPLSTVGDHEATTKKRDDSSSQTKVGDKGTSSPWRSVEEITNPKQHLQALKDTIVAATNLLDDVQQVVR